MATHAIMFEWGMPIEGRETKALGAGDAMPARMQRYGKVVKQMLG